MQWPEICRSHPDKWLIVEALEAHTTPDSRRHLDRLTVVEECPDGKAAMKRYRLLHQQYPEREFYFIHTSRDSLDIQVQQWFHNVQQQWGFCLLRCWYRGAKTVKGKCFAKYAT